jgi:hypothetical protein
MQELFARQFSAALVVALLAVGMGQPASASLVAPEAPSQPISSALVTGQDIQAQSALHCMALAVYFEGGSSAETEEGQRHIARVVHQRAKANLRKWGGSDICDVVFYKRGGVCQFSFACLPAARRTPRGGAAWQYSRRIAEEELKERSSIEERSARYYMNPALTSDRNACRFRKEFVPILGAGRHEFFREPTSEERAALARANPIECKRYAEAVEARKRAEAAARKRLAEKKRIAKLGKKKLAAANEKRKKLKYARR